MVLPPSDSWYWTFSLLSSSTMALASVPDSWLYRGVQEGWATQFDSAIAPITRAIAATRTTPRWPGVKPAVIVLARPIAPVMRSLTAASS